ncbi:MAG: hypothetical protein ACI3XO_05870 [Eubacteriales bacterium]
MNCNNIIGALRHWCYEKSNIYYSDYEKSKGITYIRNFAINELGFKLSMLVDRDFLSLTDFESTVMNLLDIHYDYTLKNPPNNVAEYMMKKISNEFCEYLHQIVTGNFSIPNDPSQYEKVIVGEEAEKIIKRIQEVWQYNTDDFIMFEYLEPYWNSIFDLIGLPHKHIYSYGTSVYDITFCIETARMQTERYCDRVYTDKNFTWFIFFCHEGTVHFSGSIVEDIKKILSEEKEHWNKYEG